MALAPLDFRKLPADQHITVWIGPENSIADFNAPTAAEINAMEMIAPALSWQDWDFGIQPSETTNEPSFADPANFQDFGAANYGGGMSLFYPGKYNDPTNKLSTSYGLTRKPGTMLAIAIRIDGEKRTSLAAADGDYIHTFLSLTGSETNSIQGADALRRTVGLLQQSVFAIYTIVGSGSATPTVAATLALAAGESKRAVVTVLGREFTNACEFTSSDPAIALPGRGGVITGVAAGTATITVTNTYTKKSTTFEVTVA